MDAFRLLILDSSVIVTVIVIVMEQKINGILF